MRIYRSSRSGCGWSIPACFVEVWDGDRTSPHPLPGANLDDHLVAVQARARRWDWFPPGRGKVIWAELDSDRAKGAARLLWGSPSAACFGGGL